MISRYQTIKKANQSKGTTGLVHLLPGLMSVVQTEAFYCLNKNIQIPQVAKVTTVQFVTFVILELDALLGCPRAY